MSLEYANLLCWDALMHTAMLEVSAWNAGLNGHRLCWMGWTVRVRTCDLTAELLLDSAEMNGPYLRGLHSHLGLLSGTRIGLHTCVSVVCICEE